MRSHSPFLHAAFIAALIILAHTATAIGFIPIDSNFTKEVKFEFSNQTPVDSASFVIPFSRAGNLILVKARVDSTEGNFILDTGCPHLVLNRTYFRDYPTESVEEERRGAGAGDFITSQTMIAHFLIGGNNYFRLPADLANLGNIETSKGVKILGLIGMQLLIGYEMIIDHEKNFIYLHRIGRKESSSYHHQMLDDTSSYHVIPFSIIDNCIIVETTLAGKKIKLAIDSGAETNLLDSRLPDKVFENVAITGRTTMVGVGSSRVEVLRGNLKILMIGKQAIESLPVIITNLEKTCFDRTDCINGVLGFDFLSLKKIGFNFVTNKMYIWK